MRNRRRLVLFISAFKFHALTDATGMGGLTCALALAKEGFENIEVYETASNLGFVGAGIQLAPNMSRILDRLGVWKEIKAEAVVLRETSIRGMNSKFPA
jgi:salicylate hydroxylase